MFIVINLATPFYGGSTCLLHDSWPVIDRSAVIQPARVIPYLCPRDFSSLHFHRALRFQTFFFHGTFSDPGTVSSWLKLVITSRSYRAWTSRNLASCVHSISRTTISIAWLRAYTFVFTRLWAGSDHVPSTGHPRIMFLFRFLFILPSFPIFSFFFYYYRRINRETLFEKCWFRERILGLPVIRPRRG